MGMNADLQYSVALLDRRPHRAGAGSLGEQAPALLFFGYPFLYRGRNREIQREMDSPGQWFAATVSVDEQQGGSYALLDDRIPGNRTDRRCVGFTGVAVAAAGIAKLLFVVFLVLFVISLVAHLGRRGTGV